ncbi:reverse transcriptase domain-containing protein [Tanacetum coccineum]
MASCPRTGYGSSSHFYFSDSSDESVGSSIPRVILIGSIPIEVPVAPEVGAAVVASPAGILELDTHSWFMSGLSEGSQPPILVAPMVSPFIRSDDSDSDTELPKRHVSSTPHDVMGFDLVGPLHSDLLALRYTSHHLDHFTFGSSSDHSSSDHSLADHSPVNHTLGHSTSDQSLSRHSSPSLPLGMRPRLCLWLLMSSIHFLSTVKSSPSDSTATTSDRHSHSPSHFARPSRKRFRYPATTMPSYIPGLGALVPTRANLLPNRKRFRDSYSSKDSVEEDIDADVLADFEADAAAIVVAVDMDVEAEANAGIGIELGDDIEDEDGGESESSDRGTMEIGEDAVARIDIPNGMLMPNAVERLEQVEEVVHGIYGHVIEIPLQMLKDIEMGHRQLDAESLIASGERACLLDRVAALERRNLRLRGTLTMESARVDRLRRCMGFMEDERRRICRFRYYDRLRFRRLEAFAARRLEGGELPNDRPRGLRDTVVDWFIRGLRDTCDVMDCFSNRNNCLKDFVMCLKPMTLTNHYVDVLKHHFQVSIMRMLRLKAVARRPLGMHLEFAPDYVSLIRKKFCWGTIFPIGLKRYRDPKEEPIEKEPLLELKEIRHVVNNTDIHVDSSYYRCFIANSSKVAKPLALLTQKIRKYEWVKEQEEAFQILKDNLCDTPILSFPDGSKEFVVYCNALNQGLSYVLMQRGKVENATTKMPRSLEQLMERKEGEWPCMEKDIATYVSNYLTRLKVNVGTSKTFGFIVTTKDTRVEVGYNNYGLSYKVSKIK